MEAEVITAIGLGAASVLTGVGVWLQRRKPPRASGPHAVPVSELLHRLERLADDVRELEESFRDLRRTQREESRDALFPVLRAIEDARRDVLNAIAEMRRSNG